MQNDDEPRKETPTAVNRAGIRPCCDTLREEWAKYARPHQNCAIYQDRCGSGTQAAIPTVRRGVYCLSQML